MPRRIHQYQHLDPQLGDTSKLSPRQREVVDLLRKGMTNAEIAAEMGITLDTATSHVNALKDRFCAINKNDLICQMWIHGVLERPRMVTIVAFLLCALATMPFGRSSVRPAPKGRPKVAVFYQVNRHEIPGVLS